MSCVTTVSRTYTWSMGHRLQRHEGLCRFPHGHTYDATVTVRREGFLPEDGPGAGMVLDFHELDAILKKVIEPWDHGFMVEQGDPFAQVLIQFYPARVVVVPFTPTAEFIAHDIYHAVLGRLPAGVELVSVSVNEGPKSTATACPEWEGEVTREA